MTYLRKEWNRPRRGLLSVDFLELAATHGSDYAECVYPTVSREAMSPEPEEVTDDDDHEGILHEPKNGPAPRDCVSLVSGSASGSDGAVLA